MYLRTNVPFQYTISGDREQVFLLYYKDFFEQICSDVQFISPPEEVGEFLLHLLNRISHIVGFLENTLILDQSSIQHVYCIYLSCNFVFFQMLYKTIQITKGSFNNVLTQTSRYNIVSVKHILM